MQLRLKRFIALLPTIIVVQSAFSATSITGLVAFGTKRPTVDGGGPAGVLMTRLESWKPVKVPGWETHSWPRFSPDGKMIASVRITGDHVGEVHVMFADQTGSVKVADDLHFCHPGESPICEWVHRGKWNYELGYPNGAALKSIEIIVKDGKISVGASRQIAQEIGVFKYCNSKRGFNGAFAVTGNRILVRAEYAGAMYTAPDLNTTVVGKSFIWPNDPLWLSSEENKYPHSCYHNLSRDGQWVQLQQNAHPKEWPMQQGDHLGMIVLPWQMPNMPAGKVNTADLPYIVYNAPIEGTESSSRISNYHWTNHPRVFVGTRPNNGAMFVIELETYPPKVKDGNSNKQGAATWTPFVPTMRNYWFGVDLWVDGGIAPQAWLNETKNKLELRTDRVTKLANDNAQWYDVRGRQLTAIKTVRHRTGVLLKATGNRATVQLKLL